MRPRSGSTTCPRSTRCNRRIERRRRCAPTAGGRTSPTGRFRPTSASTATASASRPADTADRCGDTLVARLGQSLIVVFIVTTISFFVDPLGAGRSVLVRRPRADSAQQCAAGAQQFGYDKPLLEQYRALPVECRARAPRILHRASTSPSPTRSPKPFRARSLLAGLALGLSFMLGVVVGVLQAARRGGWFDRVSSTVLLVLLFAPRLLGGAHDHFSSSRTGGAVSRPGTSSTLRCTTTWARGTRSSIGSSISCCRSRSLTLLTHGRRSRAFSAPRCSRCSRPTSCARRARRACRNAASSGGTRCAPRSPR